MYFYKTNIDLKYLLILQEKMASPRLSTLMTKIILLLLGRMVRICMLRWLAISDKIGGTFPPLKAYDQSEAFS